jgi:hypothetical protein
MDKVQIYLIVILSINLIVGASIHGTPDKNKTHNFGVTLGQIVIGLPYIGRVFGWW